MIRDLISEKALSSVAMSVRDARVVDDSRALEEETPP